MTILRHTQEIHRPAHDVFAVVIDAGDRFILTDLGDRTRIDHELEMIPKGAFKLMAPMMSRTGRKNLRATADALQRHLEEATTG
jgi:hypothetical protein